MVQQVDKIDKITKVSMTTTNGEKIILNADNITIDNTQSNSFITSSDDLYIHPPQGSITYNHDINNDFESYLEIFTKKMKECINEQIELAIKENRIKSKFKIILGDYEDFS